MRNNTRIARTIGSGNSGYVGEKWFLREGGKGEGDGFVVVLKKLDPFLFCNLICMVFLPSVFLYHLLSHTYTDMLSKRWFGDVS